MTEAEEDAALEAIRLEVSARYKGAPRNDLGTLAMMLQDFETEAAKRIPGWVPCTIETPGETVQ